MHARTWLSIVSFPVVAAFTYPVVQPQLPKPSATKVQDPLAGLADIQDVLALVQANYVEVPDMERLMAGGIQGSLERAHPMNSYLSADEARMPDPGPAEVGLKLLKRGIYAQVLAVRPGSPADRAKIQAGDVIRKLDGASIASLGQWALQRKLRGAVGSELAVDRFSMTLGEETKVKLQRELLNPLPLTLRKEGEASIVALPDLLQGRAAELKKLLQALDPSKPLVLDLRQNASGSLEEARDVASLLISQPGTLVTVQEAGKPDRAMAVVPSGLASFAKLGVLQSGSTVGAAEALAACLKKQGVALFGERTLGLGVETHRFPLRHGGALDLVHRRWLGAGGEKLDRKGVEPAKPLRAQKADEDLALKVLELLNSPAEKHGA